MCGYIAVINASHLGFHPGLRQKVKGILTVSRVYLQQLLNQKIP